MNKKLLIFKRKKAKELHEKGWSNRKIARHLLASKFWNKLQFSDEQEIDIKIKDFKDDFKDVNLENKCVEHFKAKER